MLADLSQCNFSSSEKRYRGRAMQRTVATAADVKRSSIKSTREQPEDPLLCSSVPISLRTDWNVRGNVESNI